MVYHLSLSSASAAVVPCHRVNLTFGMAVVVGPGAAIEGAIRAVSRRFSQDFSEALAPAGLQHFPMRDDHAVEVPPQDGRN